MKLLNGNFKALFCKVLSSAGVVGNVADGSAEFQRCFIALSVLFGNFAQVFEDGGSHCVNRIFGNGVSCDDNCCDSNGGNVFGSAVNVSSDGSFGVVGRYFNQISNVSAVQAYQIYIIGGCQRSNCVGGSTGYDECCVDLAVLQGFNGVAEGLVNGFDVSFGQTVSAQQVDCVEVNAGAQSTDGNDLAFQIGNGLNFGIQSEKPSTASVNRLVPV